jgi:hypothetical protein
LLVIMLIGRFVPGSSFLGIVLVACCLQGVLFLGPRSWILHLLLGGRFVSWLLVPGYCACCLRGLLFLGPRSVLGVGAPGIGVPGVAASWALLAPGIAGSWHYWLL